MMIEDFPVFGTYGFSEYKENLASTLAIGSESEGPPRLNA